MGKIFAKIVAWLFLWLLKKMTADFNGCTFNITIIISKD